MREALRNWVFMSMGAMAASIACLEFAPPRTVLGYSLVAVVISGIMFAIVSRGKMQNG